MQYSYVTVGEFIARPNRFIARVWLDGQEETVHVKNTGRCRELLVPGCRVYLAGAENPARRTAYDLIAVEKERAGKPPLLINMDSQAVNKVAAEWLPRSGLFSPEAVIRPEVRLGDSRFDFCITDGGERAWLEVKGVTLEQDGVALFPDAPTERGVKHLKGLTACRQAGDRALVLFVVQMKEMICLRPHDATHPAFGQALREAAAAGVEVLAMDCVVSPDSLVIDRPVAVEL